MGIKKTQETKEVQRFECDVCGHDLGPYVVMPYAICVKLDGPLGPMIQHIYNDGAEIVCAGCIAGLLKGELKG